MTPSNLAWLVIVLALVAANLPFVNDRLFLVVRLRAAKNLAVRLGELVVWYGVVGLMAMALEQRIGQNAPQGWEFYVVTGSLFLTFAFPGFVWRYLYKRG